MQKNELLFVLKFFIIFFIFFQIIEIIDLTFFNNLLAYLSASFLGFEFYKNIIYVNSSSFVVTNLCTGLLSISILFATVFLMKKPILFYKIKIFVFGALFILVINIPRLMFVLISAKIGFDAELMHGVTWFFMSGVVFVIWYFGIKIYENDFKELL